MRNFPRNKPTLTAHKTEELPEGEEGEDDGDDEDYQQHRFMQLIAHLLRRLDQVGMYECTRGEHDNVLRAGTHDFDSIFVKLLWVHSQRLVNVVFFPSTKHIVSAKAPRVQLVLTFD